MGRRLADFSVSRQCVRCRPYSFRRCASRIVAAPLERGAHCTECRKENVSPLVVYLYAAWAIARVRRENGLREMLQASIGSRVPAEVDRRHRRANRCSLCFGEAVAAIAETPKHFFQIIGKKPLKSDPGTTIMRTVFGKRLKSSMGARFCL